MSHPQTSIVLVTRHPDGRVETVENLTVEFTGSPTEVALLEHNCSERSGDAWLRLHILARITPGPGGALYTCTMTPGPGWRRLYEPPTKVWEGDQA